MRVPRQPSSTIVLYGCADCEYVETAMIAGTWTADQLLALYKRPPDEPSDDIEEA